MVKIKRECLSCHKVFVIKSGMDSIKRRILKQKFCNQKCHYTFGHSSETKKKISISISGNKNPFFGKKHSQKSIQKIKDSRKNQVFDLEVKKKQIEALLRSKQRGETHWAWKGGITPLQFKIRNSLEYLKWRKEVFEKDSYTCKFCGKVGGKIQADHVKPFSVYKDLRFDVNNGQVLCIECHKDKTREDWKKYPLYQRYQYVNKNV